MAAVPPTAGQAAAVPITSTTVTVAADGPKPQARPIKAVKPKRKCCWNEPGGPWPRNVMLQAATCADMHEKMMTLIVGEEEVSFTWFKDVLSFHSSFFAGAIRATWSTEAQENIVRMPEDSPDVVREVGGHGAGSDNPSISPWDYWDLMAEFYIFGNKYRIPRIQNVAVNEMIALFHEQFAFPRTSTIEKIYEFTPLGVSIRRLVTDIVVLSHENVEALIDGQSRFGDGFHPDFIQDLFKRLYRAASHENGFQSQRLTRKQWGLVSRCQYHVSEVGARLNGKKILERSRAESLP
ncbi:unnamed protein product [Aureobasidium uvarum]|uniref:BTB domain-containing protein n=1 Tax=Aureobasidium uvarum TaxID=2773716 RepID=A0A9N8PY26_9PEZI|nr:unnamed protein product [Aureobasidium uvarum]